MHADSVQLYKTPDSPDQTDLIYLTRYTSRTWRITPSLRNPTNVKRTRHSAPPFRIFSNRFRRRAAMGPPRSLFASLPPDLKRSIRKKPILQQPITSQVEIKVENVLSAMNAQGYLSTQPASPPASVEPTHDGPQSSSALEVDVEVHSTPAESSKRTVEAISTPTPTKRSNKKRKRQSIAPSNNHTDHPWDCTGLLPRYTDYNEVPADLRKCACPPTSAHRINAHGQTLPSVTCTFQNTTPSLSYSTIQDGTASHLIL